MNKMRLILALLLAAGAAAVFANGTKENAPRGATGEELTLTGKIRLQANDFPILVTNKGNYELMYPRYYADEVQVKEGDTVTVTGYTVTGPRWETDKDTRYLAVTKATVGGKEYVVPHDRSGGMMRGGMMRGGTRGGRGGRW